MATALIQPLDSSTPQGVQTEFKVTLPVELAVSLQQWFERAADAGDINSFFAQVCVLPIIEYRLDDLPPAEADQELRSLAKEKLGPAKKAELFDLVDEGECNTAVLAERFGISRTHVRRLLAARDVEMGIVREKKAFLDQQQMQEVVRLNRVEGLGPKEIASRFGVGAPRIRQLLRSKRSEAI
jgi:hypothetical protein